MSKNRINASAQSRAKTELSHMFPDHYRALYEKWKTVLQELEENQKPS